MRAPPHIENKKDQFFIPVHVLPQTSVEACYIREMIRCIFLQNQWNWKLETENIPILVITYKRDCQKTLGGIKDHSKVKQQNQNVHGYQKGVDQHKTLPTSIVLRFNDGHKIFIKYNNGKTSLRMQWEDKKKLQRTEVPN